MALPSSTNVVTGYQRGGRWQRKETWGDRNKAQGDGQRQTEAEEAK